MGIYALFYIYRSAKFGVAVFKVSMLNWLGGPTAIGICALFYIYIDLPLDVSSLVKWYSRHLCLIARGVNWPWVYMPCSIYIYRAAKFGVAVFKASMLDWLGGSICHGYMCIVLYI